MKDYTLTPTTNLDLMYPEGHPIRKRLYKSEQYACVDGLGREIPMHDRTGDARERYVGLFYFGWHSEMDTLHPINVQNLLARHPDAQCDYDHPAWTDEGIVGKGAPGSAVFGMDKYVYFWNEPIFGYYAGQDEWVLRRQGEMLADAGVDVIIFDSSNETMLWPKTFDAITRVWSRMREEGVRTPSVSYLLPFGPYQNARTDLYELKKWFSEKPYCEEMWFRWKGKPLVLAYEGCLGEGDEAVRDFFTFRACQPSYYRGAENGAQWGWLSIYPQKKFYGPDGKLEQMTVGCSQNASVESAKRDLPSSFSANEHLFGRNYTQKNGPYPMPEGMLQGRNFEEQWAYALECDPEFLFVTSWNEFLAGRAREWTNGEVSYPNAIVDTLNDNRSRDIEPTTGALKDHFYYQFVSYMRAFKGLPAPEKASGEKTIDLAGAESQWDGVAPVYRSYGNHAAPRHAAGYFGHRYDNDSCRNELIEAKVARDDAYLYFTVRAAKPLTPRTDPNWMILFLRTGAEGETWAHDQFAIGRAGYGETVTLERSAGGWDFIPVCECRYAVSGDRLTVRVPRAALNLADDPLRVDFKWCDNTVEDGEIMDVYNKGDCAPGGRFHFRYEA